MTYANRGALHSALFTATLLVAGLAGARAQIQAVQVDAATIKGKVLFGYQGWFDCPGAWDGYWSHWAGGAPSSANVSVEMYPDLSDFQKSDLCSVPSLTVGGASANFFSARNPNVTDMHFNWMQRYGLDGVLIQRFVSGMGGARNGGDRTLRNIIASSAKYGRVIAIEYDVTGANFNTWSRDIENDWKYLVDQVKITSQPNYLRERGRPLVSVWGIGLNENRNPPNTPGEAMDLVSWFHSGAAANYQASIMAGAPAGFRTSSVDARPDAGWLDVWKAVDVVQPWNVGRYNSVAGIKTAFKSTVAKDQAWLSAAGVTYMPVLFPGYSFNNADKSKPRNEIPRLGGNFIWQQAMAAKAANVGAVKIAMFDEVNEATAMFKVAAKRIDAPLQGFWLTLDADGANLPSDWYLRLGGEITKITHGVQAPSDTIPIRPGDPYSGVAEKPYQAAGGVSRTGMDATPRGLIFHRTLADGTIRYSNLQGRTLPIAESR